MNSITKAAVSTWDGNKAMDRIATQLSFGTRALGTPGHQQEAQYILSTLTPTHALIQMQQWNYLSPQGKQLKLTNIIVRYNPGNPRRMIIGTHYDSIIRAYRDAKRPDAPMPGANNSASGVAVLLETALQFTIHPPAIGVDLVFFDGEEGPLSMGEGDPHWMAVGSAYFARHMKDTYPQQKPQQAVIVDMVCYKNLKLYPEPLSMRSAPQQVRRFWDIGRALAPQIFISTASSGVLDDNNALANVGIPSFLVIGFDYAPWYNTTEDTLDKCSAGSLEGIGRTLLAYVTQQ